jgi:MFS family permease
MGNKASKKAAEVPPTPPPSLENQESDGSLEREQAALLTERDREPPKSEQIVFVVYHFLTIFCFSIVLPTSLRLSKSLGGDDMFSGLLVGLMPLVSGAMGIPNSYLLLRIQLKTFILGTLWFFIGGNVIYGLANLANSRWMLLAGRVTMGLMWGGPLVSTTYTARAFGVNKRSPYMAKVSIGATLGYAIGPLMGFVLEKFCQGVKLGNVVVDQNTIPAWFIVAFSLIMQIFVYACFEEPPKMGDLTPLESTLRDVGVKRKYPWTYYFAIFSTLVSSSCFMVIVAVFETFFMVLTQNIWGWSVDEAALAVGAIMFALIVTFWIAKALRKYEDRKIVLGAYFLAFVNCIWLFQYFKLPREKVADVVLFISGSFLLLVPVVLGFTFTWACQTKLTPPEHRQLLLGFNALFTLVGRGTGAFLGPKRLVEF